MMKLMNYLILVIGAGMAAAILLLVRLAPDSLSLLIIGIMASILGLGFILGIIPAIRFSAGFSRAVRTIGEATRVQASDAALVIMRENELFRQRELDRTFREYKEIIQRQNQSGEVLRDIAEFISEDYLSVHSWQGLMVQIPGILTGLGILGTFIGLLWGIGTLTFSSVDAAIDSIAELITGIETAFYTSISGVILSILFNILYRILWNNLIRLHSLFLDCYHKQVIPPTDVQTRHELHTGLRDLLRRLDQLPQSIGYSPARGGRGGGDYYISEESEKLLMPQVVQAMREGQFIFYLQPIVTLKTRKIIGAEAVVRWKHDSLGLLTPGAFLPVLERNAYITKLDRYVWELVCQTLRNWLDKGIRPLPITLNISKADILALEPLEVFVELLRRYKLPPRSLELDIAAGACIEESDIAAEVLASLRGMGLKVTLDNFSGDFLAFRDMRKIEADSMKLDLRLLGKPEGESVMEECFAQAKALGIEITACGIESAAQLSKLESLGCSTGQGFYFYHPMPVDEFETLAGYREHSGL